MSYFICAMHLIMYVLLITRYNSRDIFKKPHKYCLHWNMYGNNIIYCLRNFIFCIIFIPPYFPRSELLNYDPR